MRGGKGEEDNPSKGHKALRLSYRARDMAAETVWKSLLFFFFLKRFSERSCSVTLIPFKANKCRISRGAYKQKGLFLFPPSLRLFFTSSTERFLPYKCKPTCTMLISFYFFFFFFLFLSPPNTNYHGGKQMYGALGCRQNHYSKSVLSEKSAKS